MIHARTLSLLTALTIPFVLSAAPVPKDRETPEQKLTRVFGEKHVPDGCQVEFDGDVLKMALPGTEHVWSLRRKRTDAPHFKKEVDGDFVATVRVKLSDPTGDTMSHAGLFVAANETDFCQLLRCVNLGGAAKEINRRTWSQVVEDGKQTGFWADNDTTKWGTATLKIERQGTKLKQWVSEDGVKWSEPVERELSSAKQKVTVGVMAGGYRGAYSVELDQYDLQPLKPADAKK